MVGAEKRRPAVCAAAGSRDLTPVRRAPRCRHVPDRRVPRDTLIPHTTLTFNYALAAYCLLGSRLRSPAQTLSGWTTFVA